MPAKSLAQKRFFDAAAHNPEFAKAVGIPIKTAKEYSKESKGMKFGTGGRPQQQAINKPKTNHGKSKLFAEGGAMATKGKNPFMGKESKAEEAMEKKKFPSKKAYMAAEKKNEGEKMPKFARGGGIEIKGKTKGKMVTMACGGMAKKAK